MSEPDEGQESGAGVPPRPGGIGPALLVPAIGLLITMAVAAWQASAIRGIAPAVQASESCAAPPEWSLLQWRCETFQLAMLGVWVSAGSIALAVITYSALRVSIDWGHTGRAGLPGASRFGYRVAVAGSIAATVLETGILFPLCFLLFFTRLFGTSFFRLDLFVIAISTGVTTYRLWNLYSEAPRESEPAAIEFPGVVAARGAHPEMEQALERIAQALQCPIPAAVVFALEPRVFCTYRPVVVNGSAIPRPALVLSPALCRLLSAAELIPVMATEMVRAELIPPEWEVWISNVFVKWSAVAAEKEGGVAASWYLLWRWMQAWSD